MTPPDRSQWKRVDVVVPAGPLGLIVSKSPTGEGHVIVDGFRPVGGSAEPGALEKHGEIGPNSLLLGVNAHDFTDAAACWSFEKIREILVSTSSAERVVRFLVPPPPPAVQFEEIAAHEGGKRFADVYTLGKELGAGTFSVGVLFRLIKAGRYEFDSPYWDDVSAEAKDLISKMLILKPAERWTARQLLEHPWIAGDAVKDVQLTTALEELRKFNARRKFRAAVSTVKATISLTKALTLGGSPRSSKDSGDEGEQRTQSAPAVVNGSAVPPPAPTASQ
ncbi:hypothetical protein PC129_g6789 [Phytophthora cactorum]|uniref:Protein kinase domain-containing protein n=1 Tax=Phytophthora cactorum TaxID=29920 RepID=A0A8T1CQP2_9STRA|nr:hypothetical protein PC115_g8029 [Phytophthora cactorum]KAG3222522.1 hypothetical protein PC129_g6789 [Phytophthora cactorum]